MKQRIYRSKMRAGVTPPLPVPSIRGNARETVGYNGGPPRVHSRHLIPPR